MIKVASFFSLAPGKDPDEVWKFWIEKHTPVIKETPGLKKYTVSRVVEAPPGVDGVIREPNFWVMVELWFESREAHDQAFNRIIKDELPSMVNNPRVVIMEERIII